MVKHVGEHCIQIHTTNPSSPKFNNQNNYKNNFFKTKLLPIYSDLNLLKLNNIFHLEVLKLVFKFLATLFRKCFDDYFRRAEQNHSHSTPITSNENFALMLCSKAISQRSIRYVGSKKWYDLLIELKSDPRISLNILKKI